MSAIGESGPMSGANVVDAKQALSGAIAAGTVVTVRGWVRTRRDSKAGLSFVNLGDGSCFEAIQVVVPATLSNYDSEILHLTSGCAIVATGALAEVAAVIDPSMSVRDACARRSA